MGMRFSQSLIDAAVQETLSRPTARQAGVTPTIKMVRSMLFNFGNKVANRIRSKAPRDDQYREMCDIVSDMYTDPLYGPWVVSVPEHALAAGRWGANGFPSVVIGHKLAAQLMATSVPSTESEHVVMPWSCFEIRIPPGMMASSSAGLRGADDRLYDIRSLIVHRYVLKGNEYFDLIALTDGGPDLTIFEHTPTQLMDQDVSTDNQHNLGPLLVSFDERDRRSMLALIRLFIGVAIEMSNRDSYKAQSGAARSLERGIYVSGTQAATFLLTRDVHLDIRREISDYLAGGFGSAPTVRSLIRGHFKRQAHGPKSTLRKWIHVSPYWRGPDDAPVAVRSHILGGDQ